MAVVRGFWLRDQTSTRFGAWPISRASSTAVSVFAVAGTLAATSRYRLEVLKARGATRRVRAKAPIVLNWEAAMSSNTGRMGRG